MRKTIPTLGVVSAGLLLAGSPAQAVDTDMSSSLNIGIANGIQGKLPVQVPVNFCGNAIALLGTASASCVGGAKADYASGHGGGSGSGNSTTNSSLNPGIANGIQADALLQVPVNFCGNAIGLLGGATASCTGSGATANAYSPRHHRPSPRPYGTPPRSIVPLKALPIAANKLPAKLHAVAVPRKKAELGLLANLLSPVTGLLGGGAKRGGEYGSGGGGTCGNVNMTTSGNIGIANGIQAHVPIQVPVNFSGNAIGILGTATASSVGGASAGYC